MDLATAGATTHCIYFYAKSEWSWPADFNRSYASTAELDLDEIFRPKVKLNKREIYELDREEYHMGRPFDP
jgi:hypothetical protein